MDLNQIDDLLRRLMETAEDESLKSEIGRFIKHRDFPTVTDSIGVRSFYYDENVPVALDMDGFLYRVANGREVYATIVGNLMPDLCFCRNGRYLIKNSETDEEEELPLGAAPEEILGYWISHLSDRSNDNGAPEEK